MVLFVANPGGSSASGPGGGPTPFLHIPGPPDVVTFNDAFTELAHVTGSTALDTQTGQIRFADVNPGDLPTVKVEFSSFAYQDAHHNDITKTLGATEQAAVKAVEAISLQPDPGNNNNGSATWTYSFADGAFDFLGAGETLTLTYTASVDNNFLQSPETGIKQFTITITGTNDVPVITSSIPQTIAFVGGTSVPGGDLTAHVPTSGTITFDDPDLTDTHTVSVKLLLDGLDLPPTPLQIFEHALTASIATDSTGTGFGTVNWKLADLPVYLADFVPKGETITLTYAVTVTDSQNATSTQDITVTITGTDTPAVVWIATTQTGSAPGGLWSDASNWETGNVPTANDNAIIITDQLIGLTPSYPVTIDATTAAVAESLTMNDFGTSPPELINLGTLTIGGAFNMSADSVLHNSGGIVIGGGGNFSDESTITNTSTGLIELSGGTLNVGVDIANAGQVAIDSDATLALNGAAIDGGVVTDQGTLDLSGHAVLENGTLADSGQVNVSGFGNAWDNEAATINDELTILTSAALTIDQGSKVTNTGIITVVGGALEIGELTVNDATIDGGSIINAGAINLTGAAVIENGSLQNGNYILVSGLDNAFHRETFIVGGVLEILPDGSLIIDQGSKITNPHSLEIDAGTLTLNDATINAGVVTNDQGGTVDLTGSAVIENGWLYNLGQLNVSGAGNALHNMDLSANVALEVLAGGALTIDQGTDVANSGGTVTVDDNATLALTDVTVTGGSVINATNGIIELIGSAVLQDVTLDNSGQINVSGMGNALDNVDVTNRNSIEVFGGSALALDDGTSVNNTGGTITINGTRALILNDATITGGTIDNFSTASDANIDVTGSSTISDAQLNNGQVTIESNTTLTLSGDTVSGTSFIDTAAGATILIDGASTLDGVAITGGVITNTDATLTVDADQTLTLQGGAAVVGGTVSNSGTLAIESTSGATLDGVTVTGTGTIQVDRSQSTTTTPLVLDDGTTITGGKLNVGTVGALAVKTAKGATLNGVAVTNDNSIEVFAASVLALGSGTIVDNTSGVVTVDGTGTLSLSQATIDGGTINDFSTAPGGIVAGDIDITGSSTVSNAHLNNGQVTIEANQTLTLDGTTVTATTFADTADGAVIQIDGHTTLTLDHVTINSGTINDYSTASGGVVAGDIDVTGSSTISNAHLINGQVTIEANQTLTLDNDTITGTHFNDTAGGAVIQIDGDTTLKLDHISIDGGTINDYSAASGGSVAGDIDVIGSSTISNAQINQGDVTIESGQALTLDGDTVSGTAFTAVATDSIIHVDGGDTLTLNDATVSGGGVTIGADALVKTSGDVTLTNASVINDGTIEITDGTLTITGSIASSGPDAGGSIKIDSGAVLDLEGSDTQNVVFAGINGELQIDTSSFGGNISGLAATDEIDLSTIGYGPGTTGTYSGGVLTITNGTHSISMTLTGDYSDAHFAGATDGHGGTLITLNANDDAPTFAAADKAQTAAVTELADTTGSTASDSSSPASGTIHFTDTDLTDRPTATITQSVTWTSGTTDLSLSLTPTEIGALEQAFSLTQSDNTNNGVIGWSYQISDSALDFLGAGEKATVTSTVLLDDHQSGHDTATVTVTVTGANDAPVLAADSSGANGLHAISELAGQTGDTTDVDSATGTLSFTDVDLDDTHTVSQSAPVYGWSGGSLTTAQTDALTAAATLALTETDSTHSGTGSIGFTYSAADNGFDFLAAGETLKVTYDITITDSHDVSSTQPVTMTITGTNDAPALAVDSSGANGLHAITELAGQTGDTTDVDSATGTLSFTDVDLDDIHTVSQGTPTYLWSGGSLTTAQTNALTAAATLALTETDSTHTGTGSVGITYSNADSSFDFLAAGETLKVIYAVTVTDNHSGSSTQPVTFTITGTNDAPVLAADSSGTNGLHAITELAGQTGDTTDVDSAAGTLSFTDVDLNDTHTVSQSGPTYVLSDGTLDTTQADALTEAAQLTLNELDSTHSGAGSVGFNYSAPDSAFDFLAEGQTLAVTYSITVTDNSRISSSQPVTFTITGSNDAPVVDTHNSTLSYIENQAPTAIDAALTLSDVDSATLGSATVQISGNFVAGEDILGFTDQNGIHDSYDAVHGILTLTGTSSVANYEAALAAVTYFDNSDNPSAAPRTISFSVDDGASANSHSNVATATVDVTPVNDPPVVTFAAPENGAISVPENTATHVTGLSVSDVDAGSSDITVTLALPDGSSGSLSAGNFDGVTVGGSATALTVTGSLVEINTFLADTQHGVTYTPAPDLIHDVTLTVTANDHGATGSGGAMDSAPQPVLLDLVPDGLPASHASLIVNGGFETGDFSGWSLGGDSNAIGIDFLVGSASAENQGSGDVAHHGLAEALFGGIGDDVTLSQTVATNADEHYTVDFWVMNDTSASSGEDGGGSNDFSASWNGVALMPSIVNADQSSHYTEYQFDVTGAAEQSTLEFSARNDEGFWNLDDVSVREGTPDTVNQLTDQITSVPGVDAGDALTVTAADSNSLGTVTAAAGTGTIEWQFAASNAQLDHLMGLTQTYTVSDANHAAVAQTVAVSIGGLGHDQFVFNPGVGADTMVNFSTVSNSQGTYVGDTVELDNFSNIQSVSDVLHNLSTDAHGNAVVDLGNHDSITFQGINAATIQANALHMFVLHSTGGDMA